MFKVFAVILAGILAKVKLYSNNSLTPAYNEISDSEV